MLRVERKKSVPNLKKRREKKFYGYGMTRSDKVCHTLQHLSASTRVVDVEWQRTCKILRCDCVVHAVCADARSNSQREMGTVKFHVDLLDFWYLAGGARTSSKSTCSIDSMECNLCTTNAIWWTNGINRIWNSIQNVWRAHDQWRVNEWMKSIESFR